MVLVAPLLLTGAKKVYAQASLVPAQHPVYEWLHHQRILGHVQEFSYETRPLSRGQLEEHLRELQGLGDTLSSTDRSLLSAYWQEFSVDELRVGAESTLLAGPESVGNRLRDFFGGAGEPHIFARYDSTYNYAVGGFWSHGYLTVNDGEDSYQTQLNEKGVRAYGTFSNAFGVHVEAGNMGALEDARGLRLIPLYAKSHDVVTANKGNALYFEAMASAEFGVVSAHIGHGSLQYGPGLGESLSLSENASTYDWIRLNLNTRHFRLTSLHADLSSQANRGIILLPSDTVETRYATSRWMAFHRMEVLPFPTLSIAFSELLTYSARPTDYSYLNPISPLFFSELDNGDRDNALWVLDAVWRPFPRTELYAVLLADDLQGLGDIWAPDKGEPDTDRAYDLGASVVLPLGLEVSGRYLRLEPFVYTHWQQFNTFEQRGFPLGNSLGPNAEQLGLRVRKWLPWRGWVDLSFSQTTKGLNPLNPDGTLQKNVGGNLLLGDGNTGFRLFEEADRQEYSLLGLEGAIEPWRGLLFTVRYQRRTPSLGDRVTDRNFLDFRLKFGF
jgi:hypothetical protein